MLAVPDWLSDPRTALHLVLGGLLAAMTTVAVFIPAAIAANVDLWPRALQTLVVHLLAVVLTSGIACAAAGLGSAAHLVIARIGR